jgi:hypothetical protein
MAAEADRARDLLFGLLALQTGLIEQSDLFAALNAWKGAARRSMAELLIGQGAIADDQCAVIDSLVALHPRKHGDSARSLAAVTAAATPHIGDQIRTGARAVDDPARRL